MDEHLPPADGAVEVRRDGDNVVLDFDWEEMNPEEPIYLPPMLAVRLAMMLQNAASDAKRYSGGEA